MKIHEMDKFYGNKLYESENGIAILRFYHFYKAGYT